ncbi:MAG: hypothetical protein N3G48_07560 [Sulfolobales archaeon]|nr:hypothetical protein [Sulfolobales archaeon]
MLLTPHLAVFKMFISIPHIYMARDSFECRLEELKLYEDDIRGRANFLTKYLKMISMSVIIDDL